MASSVEGARRPSSPVSDDYDSLSSSDSAHTPRPVHLSRRSNFLLPPSAPSAPSSLSSTPSSSPDISRSSSPLPQFLISTHFSESDSEPPPAFFTNRDSSWQQDNRRWWQPARRRRKREGRLWRFVKKWTRRLVRHPLFPRQPITIVLSLILLSLFAVCLTFLLMYILNPDKDPLPWRGYCSLPYMNSPPDIHDPLLYSDPYHNHSIDAMTPSFPHDELDSLPPAGLFIGVFSTDTAYERRALVRSTWASHPRSRDGAGSGDDGAGTSRTVVRFILGQPQGEWERRIKLEMEEYHDIVILPMTENMNAGKTHTYFSWASMNAWVPPVYVNSTVPPPFYSYSNASTPPPPLASHDSLHAWQDLSSGQPKPWVRPDYVVKVDDDAFLMLAELEARLRVELHAKPSPEANAPSVASLFHAHLQTQNTSGGSAGRGPYRQFAQTLPVSNQDQDPLIYWGYLVTNRLHRFMAGELYALSWSLVDWVARDPSVKDLTHGAEDKQTARWMKMHPQAERVRWISERCWIYDHPRAGTVYAHGFLFPSEVSRVRKYMASALRHLRNPGLSSHSKTSDPHTSSTSSPHSSSEAHATELDLVDLLTPLGPTPPSWAHSSVSTFRVRYSPPSPELTVPQSLEALVEGSEMSLLRPESYTSSPTAPSRPRTALTPSSAWTNREGRNTRYEGKRVGGTIVVHFIKKNMWFLETALALLEGEDVTEAEMHRQISGFWSVGHKTTGSTERMSSTTYSGVVKHRHR